MKKVMYGICVMLCIVMFIGCKADSSASAVDSTPCPPPELIIKNDSEYTLNQLLMHNRVDYLVLGLIPPQIVLAVDMQSDTQLSITTLADNDTKYFTFIRNITTGSSQEYAFTTSKPIDFYECKKYLLHILEEDFFLDQEDNTPQ